VAASAAAAAAEPSPGASSTLSRSLSLSAAAAAFASPTHSAAQSSATHAIVAAAHALLAPPPALSWLASLPAPPSPRGSAAPTPVAFGYAQQHAERLREGGGAWHMPGDSPDASSAASLPTPAWQVPSPAPSSTPSGFMSSGRQPGWGAAADGGGLGDSLGSRGSGAQGDRAWGPPPLAFAAPSARLPPPELRPRGAAAMAAAAAAPPPAGAAPGGARSVPASPRRPASAAPAPPSSPPPPHRWTPTKAASAPQSPQQQPFVPGGNRPQVSTERREALQRLNSARLLALPLSRRPLAVTPPKGPAPHRLAPPAVLTPAAPAAPQVMYSLGGSAQLPGAAARRGAALAEKYEAALRGGGHLLLPGGPRILGGGAHYPAPPAPAAVSSAAALAYPARGFALGGGAALLPPGIANASRMPLLSAAAAAASARPFALGAAAAPEAVRGMAERLPAALSLVQRAAQLSGGGAPPPR